MAKNNKGLFHEWVPKPVQLLLVVLGLIPILVVNGVYTRNITFMVAGTQGMSSHFLMAYFAVSIGMYAIYAMGMRLKMFFRSKELVIGSLLLLALLSAVCGSTDSPGLFVLSSLFIGIAKYLALIEFLLPLVFLISPQLRREDAYPIIYPVVMVISMICSYFFVEIAETFNWENVYGIMVVVFLAEALIMTVFMHNKRAVKKHPLYQFHWISLLQFIVILMVLNYVLCMAQFHGWFSSPIIVHLSVLILVQSSIFLYNQSVLKRPYLELRELKRKNVYASILMSSGLGLFLACGLIQAIFLKNILGYSSKIYALIYSCIIPGIIIGGVFSFKWFKNGRKLKILILTGFCALILSNLIYYFLFNSIVDIWYFVLPMILKGGGIVILYAAIGVYNYRGLTGNKGYSPGTLYMTTRSFIGVAVFMAILSWAFYKLQLQNLSDLAGEMDLTESFAWTGRSPLGLYKGVLTQATLLAAKQIYGYTVIAGLVILVFVATHRFETISAKDHVMRKKRLTAKTNSKFRQKMGALEALITGL
ncbi:MAG: hypothetical protein ACEPOZ_10650 [Marinifilaceae bacterium]